MDGKYDDIIALPHHQSSVHPAMSMADRAAQFSPFAALTGHEDAIRETARLTQEELDLGADEKEEMDRAIRCVEEHLGEEYPISVTYFLPDSKKSGGEYKTVSGIARTIDQVMRTLTFRDRTVIPLDDIIAIEAKEKSDPSV